MNPISTFVIEELTATNNPMDAVSHTLLREAYATWCKENGQAEGTVASSRAFTKNIKDALKNNNIPFGVKKSGNKRFITGIKLKTNLQESNELIIIGGIEPELVDDIDCL
ncbi:MAG: primase-like DNA-binding domain-containing protein [Syntrophomonas sp.]